MATNSFSKEERNMFDDVLEGFQDALVLSRNVSVKNFDQQTMERTGDVIWRPQPYIAQSFSGMDQTANFVSNTQLSVPARIGYSRSSPWTLNAKELRDALQEDRLRQAAAQKLASDINVDTLTVAATQGTLFVKRSAAASGFDDLAEVNILLNEQGIPGWKRYAALSSRDYAGVASNLQVASRSFGNAKSDKAYERSFVGTVANIDTFMLDYPYTLTLAGGGAGITIDTTDTGGNVYTPKSQSQATTGEWQPVDNRFQTVTVSSTTNVAAGDAFTIATLNAVNHITKTSTGQLKTFRVIQVLTATTMIISPPIITNQVANDASAQYQNCTIGTKAANSAIVFLNTVTKSANPFWQEDAIEIIPGRYAVPTDAGAAVMHASTDQGFDVTFQKWYDIKTMTTLYRFDTLYGVNMMQPEMAGVIMFSQT